MKILVVFPYQWGYNTDYLFYCKHLSQRYEVTYIGYNMQLPIVPNENVNLIQLPYTGKFSIFNFHKNVIKESNRDGYSHVFINYFLSSSILLLLLPKKIIKIVDVRTSFIYKDFIKTKIWNTILGKETSFFKNVTSISFGVKKNLKLVARTHILPLGGPEFPEYKKCFSNLHFLYVGTFYDRNIPVTIKAFSRLIDSHKDEIDLRYTIIGYGTPEEIHTIEQLIIHYDLANHVKFKGTVRYPELYGYFASHNIGISYIPLTDYYDCQPPTKTFEYLLSGMAVLATNTSENRKVITEQNGILVGDNVDEFYLGMIEIYKRISLYNSKDIQQKSKQYSWENIVEHNLIPYLRQLN